MFNPRKVGPGLLQTSDIKLCIRSAGTALLLLVLFTLSAQDSTKILQAKFSQRQVIIDGIKEDLWESAQIHHINQPMLADLSAEDPSCNTSGRVQSIWDGSHIYFFIEIIDEEISTKSERIQWQDGVEIYFDFFNDKFPKYEEDDFVLRFSAAGQINGQGELQNRLDEYKTVRTAKGYNIEFSIWSGYQGRSNGIKSGIEFVINDAHRDSIRLSNRVFWSSTNHHGLNNNTKWGVVELEGLEDESLLNLDTFEITHLVESSGHIPLDIFEDTRDFEGSRKSAQLAINSKDQMIIDNAAHALQNSINSLRRKGKYPDPYDLPEEIHLPDPFTFMNGESVATQSDWVKRREEILDLVQYYEYGYMPGAPQQVSATVDSHTVTVTVRDQGKTSHFDAMLTLPENGNGPFPVIVSIDFRAWPGNPIYTEAGYAVLSIDYRSVASDNYDHQGAFYSLYPYDVASQTDRGTLLAWAWGASRGVDALEYLNDHHEKLQRTFDLDKLIVTGFSRCGKAALCAGLFDERFKIVNPGASGCGGAAVYRYESFGNTPGREAPYGNVYDWGTSPGCEVLGDKIRHQGHNSNEMLPRFLDQERTYKTRYHGYGQRLPYDHHELLATIAPRAVLITSAVDDYPNGVEGDCISVEAARPVFTFLGVGHKIGFNVRTSVESNPRGWGGGHWVSDQQRKNLISFANMIFFDISPDSEFQDQLYNNPYLETMNTYYGGKATMMPWLRKGASKY